MPSRTALLWVAVAVAVGVLGVVPYHAWSLRTGKLALLEIAFLGLAASIIQPKYLRWLLWLSIAGFAVYYNARSAATCWRLLMAAMGINAIAAYLSADHASRLLNWIRAVVLVNTVYMLWQFQGYDPLFTPVLQTDHNIVAGLLDNTMIAGAFTAITLPLFMSKRWCWYVPLGVVAIMATLSFGSVLVMSAILLFTTPRRFRLAAMGVVAGVVSIYATTLEPISHKAFLEYGMGRWPVWKESASLITESPQNTLIGVGPGQYALRMIDRGHWQGIPRLFQWSKAHNEPLQTTVEFGWPGLGLALACVIVWLQAAFASGNKVLLVYGNVLIAWIIAGLYAPTAHLAPLAIIGVVAMGVLEGHRRRVT